MEKINFEANWELDSERFEMILHTICNPMSYRGLVYFFNPHNFVFQILPNSDYESALIAMGDSYDMLIDSHWYLLNAICISEFNNDEKLKTIFSKLFFEPSYLALYSSIECLAEFMRVMYSLNTKEMKHACMFTKVGKALKKEHPDLEITRICADLFEDENVLKVIEFRDRWVHNQRVQLKDDVAPWKRGETIWEKHEKGYRYNLGASHKRKTYDYDIHEYSEILKAAFNKYCTFFKEALEILRKFLCDKYGMTHEFKKTTEENINHYEHRISAKRFLWDENNAEES